jgi:hypothetical protein
MNTARMAIDIAKVLVCVCGISYGALSQSVPPSSGDKQSLAETIKSLRAKQGAHAQIIDAQKEVTDDKQSLSARQKRELDELNVSSKELDDSTAPWEMFSKSLRTLYNDNPDWTGMQVLGLPMAADWNDQTLGQWRKWRVYGDTIPEWGSSYIPTSLQVTRGYEVFVENIAIPQPTAADQKQADKAQQTFNDENGKLQNLWTAAGTHWKIFDAKQQALPPNRRLTYDQWFAKFDGVQIGQQQIKVNGAAQKYQYWVNLAYKGYPWAANLVTDFSNPAFQLAAQSDDGLVLSYRTFNFTPDLKTWIDDSKQLPATCTKLTIAYDHTTHHDHSEDERWSGGASYSFGFFSFGASASGGRQTVDVNDQHFGMSFCARNLNVFTVQPSGWFNGTAVKAFANGPWIPDGPVAKGIVKLWGPDGVFNLMPTQIVVAYKPKVVVTLSKHDYDSVHTSFNAGGGFSIGPFGFGGSYHKDTNDVKWDDSSNTITAEDNSESPQIVAVVSNRLPDNK